jgi:hypothetical protein
MNERIGRDLRVDPSENNGRALYQVTLYVECAMEDSQNIDILVWSEEVGYSVMTVMKNSDFAGAGGLVLVSDLRMVFE